ncbi:MAG: hypothetical protein ACO1PI_11930 [Bacteroidota bacterium]
MQESTINKYRWFIFAFCFALIAWRAFNVTTDNGNGRDNVYGDSYSDKNVLSAARYYYDYGFNGTYWLPTQQYEGKGDTSFNVYTHYPPLPDILAGIYSKVLNSTSEPVLRLFPILWAMVFFFVIYQVLEAIIKDKTQAFIGGSILVLSNYFITWADNLHKHTLEELLKWLYVYCIYKYFNKNERENKWIAWMCIIFLLAINVSFEPPTYLAVVSIGFSLLYSRKLFTKVTVLPGIAAVTGFMLHMWQNAAYWGSWTIAYEDMMAAFKLRTTGEETAGFTVSEIGNKDFSLLDIAFEWFNRMERFYLIPGWAILLLGAWGMWHMYKHQRQLFFIALILLLASISWSFAMSHHAYVHMFTSRQWGIWIGLICAYTLPLYYGEVKKAFAGKQYPQITFHTLFILYIAAMAVSQQVYGLYLKNGFAFGYL